MVGDNILAHNEVTCLIVSHDTQLMDKVLTDVMHMEERKLVCDQIMQTSPNLLGERAPGVASADGGAGLGTIAVHSLSLQHCTGCRLWQQVEQLWRHLQGEGAHRARPDQTRPPATTPPGSFGLAPMSSREGGSVM
jgi:energy-coupling factor transporter ATP-binding protein EcfA2